MKTSKIILPVLFSVVAFIGSITYIQTNKMKDTIGKQKLEIESITDDLKLMSDKKNILADQYQWLENEYKSLKQISEDVRKKNEEAQVGYSAQIDELEQETQKYKDEIASLNEQLKQAEKSVKQSYSAKIKYTQEEFDMMCYVVQHEVGIYDIEHKRLIARVIVNRLGNPRFGLSITEVLYQRGQFTCIAGYGTEALEIDIDTIKAVYGVLHNLTPDYSKGALFYYAPCYIDYQSTIDFFENNYEYLFSMDTHRFLK